MKKMAAIIALLAVVFIFSRPVLAQEKTNTDGAVKAEIHPIP